MISVYFTDLIHEIFFRINIFGFNIKDTKIIRLQNYLKCPTPPKILLTRIPKAE